MRAITALALAIGLYTGCTKPGPGSVVKAHEAELRARVDTVLAVKFKAPLTADKTDAPVLTSKNAVVLVEVDLPRIADKLDPAGVSFGRTGALWQYRSDASFRDMCDLVLKGYARGGGNTVPEVEAAVAKFLGTKYYVILRALEIKPAVVKEFENGAVQFTPGLVRAEARIVDDKGAEHGGFRFESTNSEKLETTHASDVALQTNLDDNSSKAFEAALARMIPGSALPKSL